MPKSKKKLLRSRKKLLRSRKMPKKKTHR